jgi:hypothetical protein
LFWWPGRGKERGRKEREERGQRSRRKKDEEEERTRTRTKKQTHLDALDAERVVRAAHGHHQDIVGDLKAGLVESGVLGEAGRVFFFIWKKEREKKM